MLSRTAELAAPDAPSARDVRAARTIAAGLARSAGAEGPTPVVATVAEMGGAARVLTNGLPRLRVAPSANDEALEVSGSLRLAANTWVNGAVRIANQPGLGYPDISARIGAVPIPSLLFDPLLGLARRAAEWRAGQRFPALRDAIVAFEAKPSGVQAVVDLPQGLLRGVSKLAPKGDAIDAARADALYAVVMDRYDVRTPVDLTELYRVLFEAAPSSRGAAREHARAAMIAAAMVTVGPRVRRLAGGVDESFRPRIPATLKVRLGGRDDLAKHFALSAALAASADAVIGGALGTWKELDDSLAGGSGFSFVDLAADRAGLRLGQASTDPERAAAIASAFRNGRRVELLPMQALGFEEGMSDRAFEARYGNIATDDYASNVARIDRALDTLPVMRR